MRTRLILLPVFLAIALAGTAQAAGKVAQKGPSPSSFAPFDFGSELDAAVNDSCETAIQIMCGNIDLSGNTGLADDDYSPSDTVCTGADAHGRDVVYRLDVVAGDSLWVDYNTVYDGVMYMVTDCSDISGTCIAGRDSALAGFPERLRYKFDTPGTYYLILDGYGPGTSGAWTLAGQLVCGSIPLPPNDRCATAIPINCGAISLSGTTEFAVNDYDFPDAGSSCTGQLAGGRDVVYRLDINAGDSLWVDYTTTTDGSVYVISDCDNVAGTCVAGKDAAGPGATEMLRHKFAFSGVYYLIFDSRDVNSFGDWTATGGLDCVAVPPPNDQCANAIALPCGDIDMSGSTELATNDYVFLDPTNSCTGFDVDGKDVAFRVDAYAGDSLWIDYHTTTDGSIYILTDCSNPDLYCVYGIDDALENDIEHLRYKFTSAGTYYVILDSYDIDSFGEWTMVGQRICNLVGVDDGPAPDRMAFSGAYPNPFRGNTVLEYALHTRAQAALKIYDLQGRLVRTLFDGEQEPGRHRAAWNGTDASGVAVGPGVYFAQLTSGGEIAMRRLIFVR